MRSAKVILNPTALQQNMQRVKQLAPNSHVLAMVKADAYGHGIEFATQYLTAADAFGVACIEEARKIRSLGNEKPIVLIEGVGSLAEWTEAQQINAQCVLHCPAQLALAIAHPYANTTIWLKVNTGMNRLGFNPEQAYDIALQLKQTGYNLVLTTHFANADHPEHPLNQTQITAFLALKKQLEPIKASLCNSAAIMNWPNLQFDWVRPGIMLYGASPLANKTANSLKLQPVMQFQSNLIAIHHVKQGDSIGYGATFITTRPTVLGVVAIGYGDGYPRVVNNATVTIAGSNAPIIGRVSMDMLTIDLTDIPQTSYAIGSTVTLWGNTPTVDNIAHAAGTIGYELFCRLAKRPTRTIQETR